MINHYTHQLPDTDPVETQEWMESLDALVNSAGKERARFLIGRLMERAHELQTGFPLTVNTPYINTIPTKNQPKFPGDIEIERRIRRLVRWNAAVMVIKANKLSDGIGGHLSTFASSASLYEVGFNWFFRGKADGQPGDHIYLQGHNAPGIYARAFLEGRLTKEQLNNFRMEIGGNGLSSYPHPRLMPDFWEYPTVSMGLGPLNSIYHARFNRYLQDRKIFDTSQSKIWCFVGDGEVDEPETLGAISLAGRSGLDNLIWVVNCNLQRLDGPVRGNGKIIQELESNFRGAGWNVIKVIWGSRWDELLNSDVDGVLLNKMNATVDGAYQRYATETGAYIREHFFGPDPRLKQMVAHLSDDDLRSLPRGGHDYDKLYAAYTAAADTSGQPTVILAKTIKGWTLGEGFEGRNATHQIKKMTTPQLIALRDRLALEEVIPLEDLRDDAQPPYYSFSEDSEEYAYMMERRQTLHGFLPSRQLSTRQPLKLPDEKIFAEFNDGSDGRAVSTTMVFTSMLRTLLRHKDFGPRLVPIVADEARTFGMDSLFREFRIYAPKGQLYEPVDHDLLLSYAEGKDGQLLEEGITEAGSLAEWIAAGTSYANLGVAMLPMYVFYSMFGFQRVGDLIWSAADSRARGFLFGATAGRTTLAGEGLQHQDGHSHILATSVPACQAYDPSFAYELATIVNDGIRRMYPENGFEFGEDIFYYITIYNENYEQPVRPDHISDDDITSGLYLWSPGPDDQLGASSNQVDGEADSSDGDSGDPSVSGANADSTINANASATGADTDSTNAANTDSDLRATILFSGPAHLAARQAQQELAEQYGVSVELWSATSYKLLREEALDTERWNRLHPEAEPRIPLVTQRLSTSHGPIIATTDYLTLVPDQIARWVPREMLVLGTDGYGRSDTREALRRFFEVDAAHVVVAVLSGLAREGKIDFSAVKDAINHYQIDTERVNPYWYECGPALKETTT